MRLLYLFLAGQSLSRRMNPTVTKNLATTPRRPMVSVGFTPDGPTTDQLEKQPRALPQVSLGSPSDVFATGRLPTGPLPMVSVGFTPDGPTTDQLEKQPRALPHMVSVGFTPDGPTTDQLEKQPRISLRSPSDLLRTGPRLFCFELATTRYNTRLPYTRR